MIELQKSLISSQNRQLRNQGLAALKFTLRLNRSPACLHVVAVLSIVAYVFIYLNLPMFLFPAAGYDDGLFISHAHEIVSGHWLGPYNQFTLMKGAGYPLFLAFVSLTGIPLALAHSLFYALSIWLLAYATDKLLNSVFFSITVLEVLLWHFGPHPMRVIRDAISTPQFVVVFSLLLMAFFVLRGTIPVLISGLFAGLIFGWFWITREDGIIAAPALLFLFLCAIHRAYRTRRSVKLPCIVLATFMVSYVGVLAVIALVNLKVYDTFATVDINGSFQEAFEALESVKPDVYIPYAAVPRSSREKIYKISPTFSRLRSVIDGPNSPLQIWKQTSCGYYPSVCGDYATGWFMWAFRDAVASNGNYSSPDAAAMFYTNVHDEIRRACDSKIISCYHNTLPFMPHVSQTQLFHSYASLKSAIDELSLETPPALNGVRSMGTEDQIRDVVKFLDVENHTPPPAPGPIVDRSLVQFAVGTRDSIIKLYGKFLPMLLLLGLCSAVILGIRSLFSRSYPVAFAIACAAWIAVVCRLAALVLIDVSSFPAIFHYYISYAYPLSCYASLISIFLVGRWMCYFRWDD